MATVLSSFATLILLGVGMSILAHRLTWGAKGREATNEEEDA